MQPRNPFVSSGNVHFGDRFCVDFRRFGRHSGHGHVGSAWLVVAGRQFGGGMDQCYLFECVKRWGKRAPIISIFYMMTKKYALFIQPLSLALRTPSWWWPHEARREEEQNWICRKPRRFLYSRAAAAAWPGRAFSCHFGRRATCHIPPVELLQQ